MPRIRHEPPIGLARPVLDVVRQRREGLVTSKSVGVEREGTLRSMLRQGLLGESL